MSMVMPTKHPFGGAMKEQQQLLVADRLRHSAQRPPEIPMTATA
jgi:hypothetical protein